MKTIFSYALAATLISSVLGHGWVQTIQVDGQTFSGPRPSQLDSNPPSSAVRQISNNGPILATNVNSADMACGIGAKVAKDVIEVNPGSQMSMTWTDGGSPWLHAKGPITLYIASCGGTTCDKFSADAATGATWFKFAEFGFKDQSAGIWFQQDLQNGQPLNFQLPTSLQKGDYLLRAEIIALHNSPAEIYPSCTQIRFTGNAAAKNFVSSPSNGVQFPGAYSSGDAGFHFDVFTGPFGNYPFPGPTLSNIAPDASSDSGSSNNSSGSSSSNAPSSSGSATSDGNVNHAPANTASSSTPAATSSATTSNEPPQTSSTPVAPAPRPTGKSCKARRRRSLKAEGLEHLARHKRTTRSRFPRGH